MDIVRILEDICTDLGYEFHYGNKSHLNLIDQNGNLAPNKVHLLLFPPTRKNYNFSDSSRTYNGNFFFVMPDQFSQDYFNNTDSSETANKYESKIEPLITALSSFESRLTYCENMDILQFDSVDAVDVLDANMSGLWVTYQFKVYE